MNDDLAPDFELEDMYGLVVTPKSIVKCYKNFLVVSLTNRLVFYDTFTRESVLVLTNNKRYEISAFDISFDLNETKVVIGYENGIVKIFTSRSNKFEYCHECESYLNQKTKAAVKSGTGSDIPGSGIETDLFERILSVNSDDYEPFNSFTNYHQLQRISSCQKDSLNLGSTEFQLKNQFRAHTRAVVSCYIMNNLTVTAGLEGTLVAYDMFKEEPITFFSGNSAKIFSAVILHERIYAACSDKTIKVWKVHNEYLQDVFGFPSEISDFAVYKDFIIVFLENGNTEIINQRTRVKKSFNAYKKLRFVKIFDEVLHVLTKERLYRYELAVKQSIKEQEIVSINQADEAIHDRKLISHEPLDDNLQPKVPSTHQPHSEKYAFINGTPKSGSHPHGDFLTATDIFSEVETVSDDLLLKDISTEKFSHDYVDFEADSHGKIYLHSESNTIDVFSHNDRKIKNFLAFHSSEIFDILKINEYIVSVSKDSAIIWTIDTKLSRVRKISFEGGILSCATIDGYLVVNNPEKIMFYDVSTGENIFSFQIAATKIEAECNTLCLSVPDRIMIFKAKQLDGKSEITGGEHAQLLAGSLTTEKITEKVSGHYTSEFYGKNYRYELKLSSQIFIEEPISCLKLSNSCRLVAIGNLSNNNVHIYDTSSGDEKFKLYGHSLPVKHCAFSPDEKTILTTGADKLVKLWGLDFGECRKSFLVNTDMVGYIKNDLYIFADSSLKYYRKHELIKEYKHKYLRFCKFLGNNLIAASKHGLFHFKTLEYEVETGDNEDSSDFEDEILIEQKIVSAGRYEIFKSTLEKLEKDEDKGMKYLIKTVLNLDLSELDQFCYFLTDNQVRILFNCAHRIRDITVVVSARIVNAIFKFHGHIFENSKDDLFKYQEICQSLKNFNDQIGAELFYNRLFGQ